MQKSLVFFMGCLIWLSGAAKVEAHGLSQQMERLIHLRKAHFKALRPESSASAGNFDQLVNPQDPSDQRTFSQRYYLDSSLASGPNAPVLFYICGEATCDGSELGGATAAYAQNLKAHRIALEHRYYGYSQPFSTLSAENLKYLTIDNALSDLARFQSWAQKNLNLTGPWIVIGGSYPGALSAFYRAKYPNLTIGSLASSAPVEAKEAFQEYDSHVTQTAGPECVAKMREVVARLEASLNNPDELAKNKALFDASDVQDNVDFLYVVADMGAIAIQYGFKDSFCNSIETNADPLLGYAEIGKQLFSMFGLTAVMDTSQGVLSENPNDYLQPWGMRQWLYQSCTEFGFWQVANQDPNLSARSHLIDLAYHHNLCAKVFGIPVPVQPSLLNQKFYEPIRAPGNTSQILFLNGAQDPWSELSITTERNNSTNPGLNLYTIPGASHCADLSSPSPSESEGLQQAHLLTNQNFALWIKHHDDEQVAVPTPTPVQTPAN